MVLIYSRVLVVSYLWTLPTVVVGVVVVCLIAKNVWEQDPAVCDGGFAH